MATEVEISTVIDTAQSQQGLTGLKKGLKELVSLQQQVGKDSAHFGKLQNAINATEGKIGDLTDSFQTLRGSGVERVNSSLQLFREGLLSADTDKLKIGLQGIGSAMKAIPIFLLIEGARLLYENFGKINEVLSGLVNGLSEEAEQVKILNAEYEKQSELNKILLADLDNEIKLLKAKKAPLEQILVAEQKSFDLKLSTLNLQLAKEQATLKEAASNKSLFDSLLAINGIMTGNAALVEKSNEAQINSLTETAKKIKEVKTLISALEVDKEINKINTLNELRDQEEKSREERIKHVQELIAQNDRNEEENEKLKLFLAEEQQQKELEDAIKFVEARKRAKQDEADFNAALQEGALVNEAAISDAINADNLKRFRNHAAEEQALTVQTTADRIAAVQLLRDEELAKEELTVGQRIAIIQKAESDILAIRTAAQLQNIALVQQYTQVLSEVNNLVNQEQLEHLRELEVSKDGEIEKDQTRLDRELKNEKLSENQKNTLEVESKNKQIKIENDYQKAALKIKKQQFEKEKGLKLVNIAIDTASSLVKTTAQLGGVGALTPAGIAMLAGITALGISQAAVVASQTFDESGFASKPEISAPPSFSTGGPSPDRQPERSPTPFNPQAQVNGQQGRTQRVVVLESDIRETAERVDVLEGRATFGG